MASSKSLTTIAGKKIAAFDVCGTIYSSNTTFDFLKYYFKDNSRYSFFRFFINTPPAIILNRVLAFMFGKDLVRNFATLFLKNESMERIETAGKYFVTMNLKDRFIQPTIELLRKYKNKGYSIILISGSYDFIVKYVAEEVGADAYFASVLSKKNGLIKGRYEEDLLNKKKECILSQYNNIDDLVFVTDNKSDLDLINLASISYVVTPQRKVPFWIKRGIPRENLIVV
jgi:HAD superfamily hydrolase (TIGR01490 family)